MPVNDLDEAPSSGGKRFFHNLEFEGRRQTIAAWALEKDIAVPELYRRVRAGWTAEEALTTPGNVTARPGAKDEPMMQTSNGKAKVESTGKGVAVRYRITFRGQTKSLSWWAHDTGADYRKLQEHIKAGEDITPLLCGAEPVQQRRPRRISHPDYTLPEDRASAVAPAEAGPGIRYEDGGPKHAATESPTAVLARETRAYTSAKPREAPAGSHDDILAKARRLIEVDEAIKKLKVEEARLIAELAGLIG